jgi:hypothetical protein
MFRYSLVMLVGLAVPGASPAASWAEGMFEGLSRDFGSVPRGPLLSHPFRLTNNTGVPVTISNLRVSCGCVTARALESELAPGQSTAILTEMDTRRFQRDKNVTIYVQFSQPSFEEVRLWVQANSREDITFTPEALAFGQIKHGSSPTARLNVSFVGNSQWRITGVSSDSNYITTTLKALPGNAMEVNYQVTAQLRSDTPAGRWYTDIWLKTNDPTTPRVRVPLSVEIQSALSLSPSAVILGQVKAGGLTERKLIVRGTQPFRILGVQGVDSLWTLRDSTSARKSVHVLTISLRAPRAGELTRVIKLITDLKEDGQIEFLARAQVVP